jgi:hypothetical protein
MFANSWRLVKASATILNSDRHLLVFPLLSMICCTLLTLVFIAPLVAVGWMQRVLDSTSAQVLGVAVLFVFYFITYSIIFFCNSALVGAVMVRLRGGEPTLNTGFQMASSRLNVIFGYAAIAATVGLVLQALSGRGGGGGQSAGGLVGALTRQIVVGLLGATWNIATFLVVPILVMENVGPLSAMKRSLSLLKATFGEQLVGTLGMGAFFGLLSFLVIIVLGGAFGGLAYLTQSWIPLVIGGVVLVLALIGISLYSAALNGIYRAEVYLYAVEGRVGGNFDPQLIAGAFQPRRSGRAFRW